MIGEVDAVYDRSEIFCKSEIFYNKYFVRGALEAINVGDRPGYVKLMQQLIGKNYRLENNLNYWIKNIFNLN